MGQCDNGHITSGNYCPICGTGKTEKKKPKPIPRTSAKRKMKIPDYNIARMEYLKEYPICEVHYCHNPATDIHHKKGRSGELYTDKNHFMAVCRVCHDYIGANNKWAVELGYSEIRTN